ncbi:MAG: hypothetical protein SFU25_09465, partial [Candidatus Caenarcaniphilales bacterium]|nr:hypothetical protein [Candidatus Caenarcaniphilales bacterium]
IYFIFIMPVQAINPDSQKHYSVHNNSNTSTYINNFHHQDSFDSVSNSNNLQTGTSVNLQTFVITHKESENKNYAKSFWSFIKHHFLKGLLERAFALILALDFAHGKNPVIAAIYALIGLAAGEGLVQFEHQVEKHVESFIDNRNKKILTPEESDWTLGRFIAKAASLSFLSLIGVTKKIWYFYHKAQHHNPTNEVINKTKQGLNLLMDRYANLFGGNKTEINKKLSDPKTNILESFDEAGKWLKSEIGGKTNPFVSSFGNFSADVFQKVLGCPSILEGLQKSKLEAPSILKDASFKMAVLIPVSIVLAFITDIFSTFFKKQLPDDAPDEVNEQDFKMYPP